MDFQWSHSGVTFNFRGERRTITPNDKIVMGNNILEPLGIAEKASTTPVFRRLISARLSPFGTIIATSDDPRIICKVLKWESWPGETKPPQVVYLWASEAAALLATQQKTAASTTAA